MLTLPVRPFPKRASSMKTLAKVSLAFLMTGVMASGALAQSDPDDFTPEVKPAAPAKGEPKKDEAKTKAEEYDKAIKGLKRVDGPFPMYQRHKDLLVEVSDDRLGKLFFVQVTLETGASANLQAGDPVGDMALDVFRWEKQDTSMLLTRPNLKYRWSSDDPLKNASDRSFPQAILGSYRIEAYNPEKKLNLVNIGPLLFGETFRLNELMNMALGGQYMLDRERTNIESIKGYADDTVVQARMHYMSPRGGEQNPLMILLGLGGDNQLEDSRSVPIKVDFCFSYRKEDGYMPRLADPRIGYFTQDFYSMDRFLNTDRTERYIMRYNLKKKDPSKAISEPVKPIVWILDPSIPTQYRDAVKDGILRWNKAFEELGYKDAIQVQDPPADYDHADGRFNLVRWTVSTDTAYAVALPRVDPFSGEVLNASVTFDANFLAYVMNEHQTVATPTAAMAAKSTQLVLRQPEGSPPADAMIWEPETVLAKAQQQAALKKIGWHALECEETRGLAESAAFAWAAMQAAPGIKISKEEYAKRFISEAICHEVGHCLGLRHNFEGSAYLSTAELGDDAITSRLGTSASVMDYVPVNIQAVLKGNGNFFSPTIGAYDEWAIRYGYSSVPKATTPLGERPDLLAIASESSQPGHAYMSDENANRWDPYVATYDNAKDPVNYNIQMMEAATRTRKYALQRLNIKGQSYDKRTRLVLQALLETYRQGRMSARFLGGIRGSRSFAGDPGSGPTLNPVDGNVQREALHLIASKCFAPDSFKISREAMLNLTFDPTQEDSATWTAPMRELATRLQDMLFATVMSGDTTDRIVENSYKLQGSSNGYTIEEHFSSILGAVFREVGQNRNIDPTRRDLQRFAVGALITQAGAPDGAISEDVRMLASDSLRRLSARFGAAEHAKANLDEMTRIHLRDTRAVIDRFLNRQDLSR